MKWGNKDKITNTCWLGDWKNNQCLNDSCEKTGQNTTVNLFLTQKGRLKSKDASYWACCHSTECFKATDLLLEEPEKEQISTLRLVNDLWPFKKKGEISISKFIFNIYKYVNEAVSEKCSRCPYLLDADGLTRYDFKVIDWQ